MNVQSELRALSNKAVKLSMSEHSMSEASFKVVKDEALSLLKQLFGEISREYRVVYWSNSPATIAKVLNHILARTSAQITDKVAVNL